MTHDPEQALTGISGILVTPYDTKGEIAPDKLALIIDRALGAGMHIPVVIRAEQQNGTNVTGVKAALMAIGLDCGPTRPPSAWPLTKRQQQALDGFVKLHKLAELRKRIA